MTDQARGVGRRRLPRGVLALSLLVLAVVALVLARKGGADPRLPAATAWKRYVRCLVGDAPLAPGETLRERLSRVELASEQDAAHGDWPAPCAPLAIDFTRAASELAESDPGYASLRSYAESAFPLDVVKTGVLASLFTEAAAAGLPGLAVLPPPDDGPSVAPESVHPLTLDQLAVAATGEWPFVTGTATAGGPVRLLWASWPRRACRVDGALRVAHCTDLSPAIGGLEVELAEMDDAVIDPLVVVDARSVVRGSSGAVVASAKDGLGRADGSFLAVTPRADHADQGVVGDRLVVVGPAAGGRRPLLARAMSEPESALTTVGTVPDERVRGFRGCRSSAALAVAVVTERGASLAFFADGRWSTVVAGPGSWWDRGTSITCRDREATLTRVDKSVVSQLRCTPESCASASSPALVQKWFSGDPHMTAVAATDLDGKVLVVGTSSQGGRLQSYLGAVRFRIAPLADLAKAPDVVLLGAEADDSGLYWNHVQTYGRGASALVVVGGASNRFYLARVDATGTFAPVTMERGP